VFSPLWAPWPVQGPGQGACSPTETAVAATGKPRELSFIH